MIQFCTKRAEFFFGKISSLGHFPEPHSFCISEFLFTELGSHFIGQSVEVIFQFQVLHTNLWNDFARKEPISLVSASTDSYFV